MIHQSSTRFHMCATVAIRPAIQGHVLCAQFPVFFPFEVLSAVPSSFTIYVFSLQGFFTQFSYLQGSGAFLFTKIRYNEPIGKQQSPKSLKSFTFSLSYLGMEKLFYLLGLDQGAPLGNKKCSKRSSLPFKQSRSRRASFNSSMSFDMFGFQSGHILEGSTKHTTTQQSSPTF